MRTKTLAMVLLMGIVLTSLAMVPDAVAYGNSLNVIVTVEDKVYNVGDAINITVHVFDKGEYASADEVNVSVGWYPVTYVAVTATSTGTYEGSYTIKPTDDYVSISAEVTRGTDSETGYVSVTVGEEEEPGYEELEVNVKLDDPTDHFAQPGDAVEITVTVKDNGTLVNADGLELTVNDEPLTYSNTGMGIYQAAYNVPSTLTEGDAFGISADASKGDKYGAGWTSFYVMFYTVWYHNITLTNTSATFELYVAEPDGNAVPNAIVNISYDDDWGTPDASIEQTTDSEGRAAFTISYSVRYSLWLEGTASYDGKSQKFEGYLWTSKLQMTPSMEGFDVICLNVNEFYEFYSPGDDVTRRYTAYNDGVLWASQDVYYYIVEGFYPTYGVLEYGSATTDADGQFTLTFTAPSNQVFIYFEGGTPKTDDDYYYDEDDNLVYDEDVDYIPIWGDGEGFNPMTCSWDDANISIAVGSLVLGGTTTVNVTATNASVDAEFVAVWVIGGMADLSFFETIMLITYNDWQCWSDDPTIYLTKTNGDYTGVFVLPEFMPQDTNYTIIAGWITGQDAHLNRLILKPGETIDTDGDGIPDTEDAFPSDPSEWLDTDEDCIGDNADTDDDNDGISDVNDTFPLNSNEWLDTDEDGIGDNADTDDDNDTIPDVNDTFPLDPDEWRDTDNDGVGDNADADDDGDGIADANDTFPLNRDEWRDTDNDGVGDNADADDDNDTIPDVNDTFPQNPGEWLDTDEDGIGDNADTDDDNDTVPDVWELAHGLDPKNASDANADPDGDGYTNLQEYEADTDPQDATSHVVVKDVVEPNAKDLSVITLAIIVIIIVCNMFGMVMVYKRKPPL